MARDPDEDALNWGDDGDPTYLDSPAPDRSSARPADRDEADAAAATSADPAPTDALPHDESATEAATAAPVERQAMSSVMLLSLGVLAGVYLLYTAGWFTSAARNIAVPVGALDVVMAQLREYLSVAAPALWFVATLLLTRGRKASLRLLLLVLGAIVLLPLPFALGV
ncbi:hypothetical protein B0I08_103311 [Glaciihabitans tibetensis]|uniref:DNA polymerase III subunit gamma/tau n=1 Tax=Glaciihabitans tibetensis TaxID=1266600 RepID=A0A2T0VFY5_9MICO|nr:hypothetical protein [Glaciihabitans tibetensis]PRY69105.1 hypothetical protein B0I08_103311 [Glaciihabitans tibetensis]